MVWVNSEYADEFAVVSAWIAAFLPWYAGYAPDALGNGPRIYIRFPFLQFRYYLALPHNERFRQFVFLSPWDARSKDLADIAPAYDVWLVGAAVVALAVLLSFAMYWDVDATRERLPVHPVRVMGSLLAVASLFLAAATLQFYRLTRADEVPIPLGLLLLVVLATVLLRVDLVDPEGPRESSQAAGATPE